MAGEAEGSPTNSAPPQKDSQTGQPLLNKAAKAVVGGMRSIVDAMGQGQRLHPTSKVPPSENPIPGLDEEPSKS